MTAQECISSSKQKIFDRWLSRTNLEIPAAFEHSNAALVDELPMFIEHLLKMLKTANLTTNDFAFKWIAEKHGEQRAALGNYTLRQVSLELTLLQEIIFEVIKECNCSLSVDEAKIISLSFQTTATEAGAAFFAADFEERQHSETQFKLLVQEARDYSIFMLDPKGFITSWNEGAHRMKQYTSEEAIGQFYGMLYREQDQKAGLPEVNLRLATETGRHDGRGWRRKKDGTLFWADTVMTVVRSSLGDLLGFSKIVRDLTAKKRTEDELLAAKEAAEAASSLKTIFVANMSHEIRTPLGAILGFCEFLKEPDCSPENRLLAAEVIDRNGKVLLRLIEDILHLSKIESGKVDIELGEVTLNALVTDISSLFEAKAHDKGVALTVATAADVPQRICTDPVRLRQILSNVVGNAVKFTERGEVKIEVHRAQIDKEAEGVEFIVTDTGAGLTAKQREGLFAPFTQADSSATRKFGGTGLGLALSRRLARNLGGDVVLLDNPTIAGCSFRITIADMNATYLQSHEDARAKVASPAKLEQSAIGLIEGNILVVDDSPDNRMLIQTFLKRWGIKSETASNGAEGLEMALAGNYDLVLMDIQMPVLDGNQATIALRNSDYKRPIIALTAHAMNEEKAKSFDAGFDDYLTKPIDKSRLFEVLKHYIGKPDISQRTIY
jgi:PAS domain S-box-containing protein